MPNQHPRRTLEELRVVGSSEQYRRRGEIPVVEGEPEPPEWLDEHGLKHWNRLATRLRNAKLLSESWREPMAAYCEAWQEYEALVIECKGQPMVVYGKNDAPYMNPLYAAKAKAWDRVLKVCKEFGFTPASKTGIRIEPGQAKNRKGYIKGA